MSYLITGGLGYIGSHCIAGLYEKGFDCVIIDNLSNSDAQVLTKLETLTKTKIPFYQGDIKDQSLLDQIFTTHNIDAVFHFAALKSVEESCKKPFLSYDNNINGTITLLQAMVKHQVTKLIFSSSATVYDTKKAQPPYQETDPTGNCSNPYGTTKILMEQIIRDICLHQGMSALCLRYFNPIGVHPSGLIGEDPKGVPSNLFPYVFKVATGELPFVTIFGDQRPTRDGTGERDYIDIQDLINGHRKALEYLEKQNSGFYDSFNLGSNQGTTVLEAVKLIETTINKKIVYKIGPIRQGDIAISIADASKATTMLGRNPQHTLTQAIQNTRNFLQKN